MADQLQLWVDREVGILLKYQALFETEIYAICEAESLKIDNPIPDEVFILEPQPDDKIFVHHKV